MRHRITHVVTRKKRISSIRCREVVAISHMQFWMTTAPSICNTGCSDTKCGVLMIEMIGMLLKTVTTITMMTILLKINSTSARFPIHMSAFRDRTHRKIVPRWPDQTIHESAICITECYTSAKSLQRLVRQSSLSEHYNFTNACDLTLPVSLFSSNHSST